MAMSDIEKVLSGLGNQIGAQPDSHKRWAQWTENLHRALDRTPLEMAMEIRAAFLLAREEYGDPIAAALFDERPVVLPQEILQAADYLHTGGSLEGLHHLSASGALAEGFLDGMGDKQKKELVAVLESNLQTEKPEPAPGNVEKRAAVYIRTSGELDQERERMLTEYTNKMGYDITESYRDMGTGSKLANRLAFRQLLNRIESGEINAVFVSAPSQLSRSLEYLTDTIIPAFANAGIPCYCQDIDGDYVQGFRQQMLEFHERIAPAIGDQEQAPELEM